MEWFAAMLLLLSGKNPLTVDDFDARERFTQTLKESGSFGQFTALALSLSPDHEARQRCARVLGYTPAKFLEDANNWAGAALIGDPFDWADIVRQGIWWGDNTWTEHRGSQQWKGLMLEAAGRRLGLMADTDVMPWGVLGATRWIAACRLRNSGIAVDSPPPALGFRGPFKIPQIMPRIKP